MAPNFLVLAASAIIPFIFAYIWYHPRLFGGETWKELAGLTDAQHNTPVKPIKLALTLLLNFLIAFGIYNLAVHANGVFGLVGADIEAMTSGTSKAFLDEYGNNHRSFGHGLIHGAIQSVICFVIPILGYVTIFDKKSTKYFLVNVAYWAISLGLMGGVICKWGVNIIM